MFPRSLGGLLIVLNKWLCRNDLATSNWIFKPFANSTDIYADNEQSSFIFCQLCSLDRRICLRLMAATIGIARINVVGKNLKNSIVTFTDNIFCAILGDSFDNNEMFAGKRLETTTRGKTKTMETRMKFKRANEREEFFQWNGLTAR